MSASTVLALKYRPNAFTEVVGQPHVVRVLEQMLSNQRLHQAYLFSGTRGVGKTTLARLFAKCLSCELGVSAHPCNQCGVCEQIKAGCFADLIEVDAASRTRVEDTREMIENACYLPTQGRFKVYLIDEVHMLSTHSFNALLKTLEEPPEHVKFLLATTDPQKLPVTVLSRCLHFRLKSVGIEDLSGQIAKVLRAENITYEQAALRPLAEAAGGSLRDALTLLEQMIAFSSGEITHAQVCGFLGVLDAGALEPLFDALVQNDPKGVDAAWQGLLTSGAEPEQVLKGLMRAFHGLALSEDTRVSSEWVQIAYQALVNAQRDMPFSVNDQIAVEMALLRILHCSPWIGQQNAGLDGASIGTPVTCEPHESSEQPQGKKKSAAPEPVTPKPIETEKKTEVLDILPDPCTKFDWFTPSEWVAWLKSQETETGLGGSLRHIVYNLVIDWKPPQLALRLQGCFQVLVTESIKKQVQQLVGTALDQFDPQRHGEIQWLWYFDRVDDRNTAQAYLKQVAEHRSAEGVRTLDALPLVHSLKAAFNVTLDLDSLKISERLEIDSVTDTS